MVGAGGHAKVVADTARALGAWQDVGLLDDRFPDLDRVEGSRVVGHAEDWRRYPVEEVDVLVGIGDNRIRLEMQDEIEAAGYGLPVLIHPRAWVSPEAQLGPGTVVFAGAVVNSGARVGRAVILNTAATVDHDCTIGEGAHLSPGVHLGGGVGVGQRTWLGIGAVVRHGMHIGADVMVGAGAAVVSDLADGVTALGVPARPHPLDNE